MNHDCVDFVSTRFGPYLKSLLDASLRSYPSPSALPSLVSGLLRQALEHIDQILVSDFVGLFPRELDALRRVNPTHAKNRVNDKGGENSGYHKTARAFGGSTALVTLVDPRRRHLWVANVGDCVAGRSSATLEPRIALASLTNKVSSGGTGSIRKVGKPRPQLYSQREQPR